MRAAVSNGLRDVILRGRLNGQQAHPCRVFSTSVCTLPECTLRRLPDRDPLCAVAVGQRNGLVEKPQTRAGRLKTEVVYGCLAAIDRFAGLI